MASDFSTLQADFFALGFNRLNDAGTGLARAKRYLNLAYKELVLEQLWTFRETDATGAAPLTVSDLGVIASVTDTAQRRQLQAMQRQSLVDAYTTLTTTGTPSWYYLLGKQVNTFPVGGTLSVHHWKVPADLSAGGDTPIVPDEYHDGILMGAGRRAALRDQSTAQDAADFEGERQRILRTMVAEGLAQVNDNYSVVDYGASEDWGGGY